MEESSPSARIEAAVRAIPAGRVSTYGAVARAAGLPRGARQVVRVLHSRSAAAGLPWHRVVRADGRVALPPGAGFEEQVALLASERVAVTDGRVDLVTFGIAPRGTA